MGKMIDGHTAVEDSFFSRKWESKISDMSKVKYKEYFEKMLEQNKDLFDEFAEIHTRYVAEPVRYQAIFNSMGAKVTEIIRDWDRRLCSAMGRGAFSQYSQGLSEKFWGEVRKMFPAIDRVGVIIKK